MRVLALFVVPLVTTIAAGPGLELRPETETLASVEAETTVVGAFLIAGQDHAERLSAARALISPAMFTRADLRAVYEAILAVRDRGDVPDVITVSDELKRSDSFDGAGGWDVVAGLVDAVPTAVNVEYHAGIIRDKARRRQAVKLGRLIATEAPTVPDLDALLLEARGAIEEQARKSRSRFRLLTEDELGEIRRPAQLIDGHLVGGGLNALIGAPEAGKTLLALAWAMHIRENLPWMGRAVTPGSVVFISGEGSSGLNARIRAWEDFHDRTGSGLYTLPDAVHLPDRSEVDHFLRALERLEEPPVLVVVDTLARCMGAFDENKTPDMNLFIEGCDRIRNETGAAVLILHHPNAAGERERGNTALRGAVDMMAKLSVEGSLRVLRCEKSKDQPHFDAVTLRLTPHRGSAVLTPTRAIGVSDVFVTPGELQTLRSLQQASLEEGLTVSAWEGLAPNAGSTFYSHRKSLVDKGLVERDRTGRGALYVVTPKGSKALEGSLQ